MSEPPKGPHRGALGDVCTPRRRWDCAMYVYWYSRLFMNFTVYHLGLWRLTETILATAYEMQIKISEQLNLLHEIYMNFRLNFYRIFTNVIHESSIHIMSADFCESP